MNMQIGVENMRCSLSLVGKLEEFRDYSPSTKTGYAYDTSGLIKHLKLDVKKDCHCPASFSICCIRLKESLNNDSVEEIILCV
jgi:hypothetical protein